MHTQCDAGSVPPLSKVHGPFGPPHAQPNPSTAFLPSALLIHSNRSVETRMRDNCGMSVNDEETRPFPVLTSTPNIARWPFCEMTDPHPKGQCDRSSIDTNGDEGVGEATNTWSDGSEWRRTRTLPRVECGRWRWSADVGWVDCGGGWDRRRVSDGVTRAGVSRDDETKRSVCIWWRSKAMTGMHSKGVRVRKE
ncbi:hypothetical protein BLNAU_11177 [Blattamonas nauphoetae]|uniref:Uncharacterized protein n=1 Tax=Blattamonas nauphoetae TaxID=2049346 RepID=A0ABQ9XND0_9EUKA|nr:hypothetical protein BLNAU_11177 [Blattamonas nauphoetae]